MSFFDVAFFTFRPHFEGILESKIGAKITPWAPKEKSGRPLEVSKKKCFSRRVPRRVLGLILEPPGVDLEGSRGDFATIFARIFGQGACLRRTCGMRFGNITIMRLLRRGRRLERLEGQERQELSETERSVHPVFPHSVFCYRRIRFELQLRNASCSAWAPPGTPKTSRTPRTTRNRELLPRSAGFHNREVAAIPPQGGFQ